MKEIKLTQGCVALVDDKDYDRINQYKWQLHKVLSDRRYAMASVEGKRILMHRFILNMQPGEMLDHINGSGLDNRRENLRKCNHTQNMSNRKLQINNTSGYKGVTYMNDKPRKKPWRSEIYASNKRYHLGFHSTKTEAAKAYNEGATKHHGEFARLNEIS